MIKHILSVGDSFTYGEELSDQNNAYPCVLSRLVNAQIVNLAKPGSGNKRMIRTVIDYIAQGNAVDLVVVGWSSPGRMEFADADGFYDIWPGYGGNMFRNSGQAWRLELLDYINKHHNPEYLYHQFLIDAMMLQSFLKEKNIQYLMLKTVANEYYHNIYYPRSKALAKLVDAENFVGWPSKGMAEWTEGCQKGPNGHFLDDGHKQVANKLYEHIRSLGWLS